MFIALVSIYLLLAVLLGFANLGRGRGYVAAALGIAGFLVLVPWICSTAQARLIGIAYSRTSCTTLLDVQTPSAYRLFGVGLVTIPLGLAVTILGVALVIAIPWMRRRIGGRAH
jgi:hypothetical protein